MMKLTVIGVAIAIGLVGAFGLYLLGLGLRNVGRAAASSHWPRTAAKVVRSETRKQRDIDRKTGAVSVIYSADTVIQYEVAGKQYSTNLIHFGQTLGSGDASEAELQRLRYPVDGEASVSYDPSQPWIAAARPGLHAEAFWLPGAGLAFLLPAALALFVFLTAFRAAPQQQRDDERVPEIGRDRDRERTPRDRPAGHPLPAAQGRVGCDRPGGGGAHGRGVLRARDSGADEWGTTHVARRRE